MTNGLLEKTLKLQEAITVFTPNDFESGLRPFMFPKRMSDPQPQFFTSLNLFRLLGLSDTPQLGHLYCPLVPLAFSI